MQNWRTRGAVRAIISLLTFALAWWQVSPAFGEAKRLADWQAAHKPSTGLPKGLTQTPNAALRQKIAAREAAASLAAARKLAADIRVLSPQQMRAARGRGPLRNAYFNGTLPWQRSFQDVNLCNGNLFKSFTDVQVAPGRGAGLVLQRTYNSNDSRVGPFGVGWTHAYDIRIQEASTVKAEEGQAITTADMDMVPRTDFFGAKHSYHRDADGLYSPPAYLFDETDSNYDTFLTSGPTKVLSDTEKGMDGTVKHFTNVLTLANGSSGNERACDSITDRYGNATTLTYGLQYTQADGSTRKLLTQVTDPVGRHLDFTWQNFGTAQQPAYRITQVQGPLYRVTYEYYLNSSDGASYLNLWKVHLNPDTLNRTTTYTYTSYSGSQGNEDGLLASVSDPLGHTVSYIYALNPDFGNLWVNQIIEPAGVDANNTPRTQTWTNTNSAPSLNILRWVNNNGFAFYVVFDASLRKINLANNTFPYAVDGSAMHRSDYDQANNVINQGTTALSYDPGVHPSRWDNFSYGPHGNVLTHTVVNNGSNSVNPGYGSAHYPGQETTTYYNASQYFQKSGFTDMNGHTSAMGVGTNKAGTPGDPDPNPGDRGQVLWVQDAGYNAPSSPSYHKQFTYTYNSSGQKTSETNLNGVVTTYAYGDAWGNLTQVVQDAGTGKLNRTTSMVYDVAGRITQSTDPMGRTSTFTYNVLGQPLSISTPATATTPAETISYTYGTNGRTESVTDNRGTTAMTYETGCERVSSVTDPVTGTISYTYTPMGARLSMTLPGGATWTYAYVAANAFNAEVLPKDDPNSLSQCLQSITDDQGSRVDYDLDTLGAMRSVRFNQTFNPSGALVSYCQSDIVQDMSNLTPSGTYQGSYRYSRGWLSQLKTTWHFLDSSQGSQQWRERVLSENDYTFDNAAQRLSNQVTLSNYDGTSSTTRTEQYGYDDLNRLTSVSYGDGQTQTYSFDAMGNRTSRGDSVSGSTSYAFDAANRLTGAGGQTYTNDANGNTLTGGGRTNTWDGQNRMVSCVSGSNTSTFTYGADGLRRRSVVNGTATDFVLDGSSVIQEKRNGATYAVYFTGAQGPAYRRDASGVARWYVYDGLGSVAGEVDPAGNMTASSKYDVYGGVRSSTGTRTTAHGFVGALGHPSEAGTGLIYMRARYYDPQVGRFASEDPAKQGSNWFSYCSNNPINEVDADGKVGKFASEVLALLTNADAYYLGLLFTMFALFSNMVNSTELSSGPVNSVGIAATSLACGIAAAVCFAVALGGNAAAAMVAVGICISALVREILAASKAGQKLFAGASGLALGATDAAAGYALALVGALIADEL